MDSVCTSDLCRIISGQRVLSVSVGFSDVGSDRGDVFIGQHGPEAGHLGTAVDNLGQHVVVIADVGALGKARTTAATATVGSVAGSAHLLVDGPASFEHFLADDVLDGFTVFTCDREFILVQLAHDADDVPAVVHTLAKYVTGLLVLGVVVQRVAEEGHLGAFLTLERADHSGEQAGADDRATLTEQRLPHFSAFAGAVADAFFISGAGVQGAARLVGEDADITGQFAYDDPRCFLTKRETG